MQANCGADEKCDLRHKTTPSLVVACGNCEQPHSFSMRNLTFNHYLYPLALVAGLVLSSASIAEIAHWIDDAGVHHYANPQFAPPGKATLITLQPANGMVVPVAAASSERGRPRMLKISKAPKHNKLGWRGWRGYRDSRSHSQRRRQPR